MVCGLDGVEVSVDIVERSVEEDRNLPVVSETGCPKLAKDALVVFGLGDVLVSLTH